MSAIELGAGTLRGLDTLAGFGTPVAAPRAVDTAPTLTLVPRVEQALERRRAWERQYALRLQVTDGLVIIGSVAATTGVTFFVDGASATGGLIAVLTVATWMLMLTVVQSRATSVMGSGSTEYKRVAHASAHTFGLLAALFLIFQWQQLRPDLLFALPAGTVALIAGRWMLRKWLHNQRASGAFTKRAIVAGSSDDIEYVLRTLDEAGSGGYTIIGVAPSDGPRDRIIAHDRSYDVVGTMNSVASHARTHGADTIIVANRPDDDPDFIKRLSWELEGTASELVLSSRIADVAGPRISLAPVDGLPLIHVKIPEFEGGHHALKRVGDIVFSLLVMIPISLLVMPVVAMLIKLDDGGPVFFRQTRIGRDGQEFGILKFRTMGNDAEQQRAQLESQNEGSGVLFKIKNDPRVTRIGAFLRKYSIDELPQFWNVLRGDMSVVGPRPPLPSEVRKYAGKVYRRLFIKPGITGLWQISGRSDLSWEESVRLDLRYVENWSVMSDLMIMWRTAKVMIAPRGAY
ncbi:sugar transferase [Microbacterium sp. NPDC055910]|uniref:sugar transferase n=1 Tax=Microbacterium sp. NPDC055910 TaxID=3345659 RepID=UPI0035DC6DD9